MIWIRRFALGIGVAIAIIVAYTCYLRIFGGQTIQRLASPNGSVVAEVNKTGAGGATETTYTGVLLRSAINPFRVYVFAGLDYGAQISIAWIDSKNLLIRCLGCEKLNGGNIKLDHWNDIAIHYEIR